jgi:hypothetical protein
LNVGFRAMDYDKDWPWINEQVPILWVEDTRGIIAFDQDSGFRIGACVFDNWTHNSVQCHLTITNIATLRHGFIDLIADVVFNQEKKRFIYGMVPSDKVKAIKINKHIGFTEKMRLEDGFSDGIDYIVMELQKANCRYL